MNFGQAIEILKCGGLVTRRGWKDTPRPFLFMRPKDELSVDIVLGARSFPKAFKDWFELNHQPITENFTTEFTAYICMKAADGAIINGWVPSQTDMLAEDWGEGNITRLDKI